MRDATTAIESQLFGHSADDITGKQIAEEERRAIYMMSTNSPLKSKTGDLRELTMFAGQVTGQIVTIDDAQSVVKKRSMRR